MRRETFSELPCGNESEVKISDYSATLSPVNDHGREFALIDWNLVDSTCPASLRKVSVQIQEAWGGSTHRNDPGQPWIVKPFPVVLLACITSLQKRC